MTFRTLYGQIHVAQKVCGWTFVQIVEFGKARCEIGEDEMMDGAISKGTTPYINEM
jgi:hypothetical protein